MTTKKEGARKKATTTQTASRANLPDGGCVALQRRQQHAQRVESIGADRSVSWQHGLQIWLGVGANAEDGRAHVARRMTQFYKLDFEAFAKYTPTGTPHQIANDLRPFVEAGATHLNLTACGADRHAEIEAVAEIRRLLKEP